MSFVAKWPSASDLLSLPGHFPLLTNLTHACTRTPLPAPPAGSLGAAGGGGLRLWAVDVSPWPTPSLMAYQLFDFLTVGSWDPAR